MSAVNDIDIREKRFQLAQHPWIALFIFTIVSIFVILLGVIIFRIVGAPDDSPIVGTFRMTLTHLLMLFVITPFILRLPKGKRSFREYLSDIGLSRVQPLGRLLILGLSCYLILALSQATGSLVFRLSRGLPVTGGFIRRVFDLTGDLPPASLSLLISFPSIFEEVGSRGVILTLFRSKYSTRMSIVISAACFGLMHLLNMLDGREPVWVVGQVVWAFILGLFYGYVFVKSGSLLPCMIVHYLGNAFIGSLTGYIQTIASVEIQALYGVVFSLGIVPTTLMILWVRFFSSKWLPAETSA